MKNLLATLTSATLLMTACNNKPAETTTTTTDSAKTTATATVKQHFTARFDSVSSSGPFSQFIPIDSANKMLNSYLTSINSAHNDSDLYSIIFSADSLRKLLSDSRISNVKIMLGHTLNYINAGYSGVKCGYQSGALTFIIAGYDNTNTYIYSPANKVLEMGKPCPPNCPSQGAAANNTLTVPQ